MGWRPVAPSVLLICLLSGLVHGWDDAAGAEPIMLLGLQIGHLGLLFLWLLSVAGLSAALFQSRRRNADLSRALASIKEELEAKDATWSHGTTDVPNGIP